MDEREPEREEIMVWFLPAGDDGILSDSLLTARVVRGEMQTVCIEKAQPGIDFGV